MADRQQIMASPGIAGHYQRMSTVESAGLLSSAILVSTKSLGDTAWGSGEGRTSIDAAKCETDKSITGAGDKLFRYLVCKLDGLLLHCSTANGHYIRANHTGGS